MKRRYLFEITDGMSPFYTFAYFDTEDHLADFLFDREKVDVTVEGEFAAEDDPYRIILCHIPRKQREAFLRAVDDLPAWMAHLGKPDYDAFCIGFLLNANAYMKSGKAAGRPGSIPLQQAEDVIKNKHLIQ